MRKAIAVCILFSLCYATSTWAKTCKQNPVTEDVLHPQLWRDLESLSSNKMQGRKGGTEGAVLARNYLIKRYQQLGLRPLPNGPHNTSSAEIDSDWLHFFSPKGHGEKSGANVIGFLPGKTNPERFIVITAHYDHVGIQKGKVFPGANDNASGVAAMLYLAAKLHAVAIRHSFLFLATDYEEAGLYGAKAFFIDEVLPTQQIVMNLNLDMVGGARRRQTLYVAGTKRNKALLPVVEQVASLTSVCIKTGLDSIQFSRNYTDRIDWRKSSDHWVFLRRDIPWLFLTVRPDINYHTPRDTADRIPKQFFFGAASASFALAIALDNHF